MPRGTSSGSRFDGESTAAVRVARRRFAFVAAAVAGFPALAAPRANARVGYLERVKESDGELLYRDFVEAMQAKGYAPGRNLRILRRSANAQPERLRALAVDLANEKVDLIVATTTEAAKAAKVAAPSTPVVFVVSSDPVVEGLVASIARPGGNLTGLVTRSEDLTGKRLQLLKDAFPHVRTVALVGSNVSMARIAATGPAARLGLALVPYAINHPDDYRDQAAAILRGASDAVLVVEDADEVVGLTAFTLLMMATRRPVMFTADVFIESAGSGAGLMAYGVSLHAQYRRVATLVARLLEGARPADIPVEQPTHYELGINLRAAEQYGIALPREFVQRADRVIR
ncbi:MAG TPA: ABC transporter substrate-binding protein [Casimicrobiaceae bacterium]|nr:ABC transporter substrate-binding protein [Casimicrobiaceae bacterium]